MCEASGGARLVIDTLFGVRVSSLSTTVIVPLQHDREGGRGGVCTQEGRESYPVLPCWLIVSILLDWIILGALLVCLRLTEGAIDSFTTHYFYGDDNTIRMIYYRLTPAACGWVH